MCNTLFYISAMSATLQIQQQHPLTHATALPAAASSGSATTTASNEQHQQNNITPAGPTSSTASGVGRRENTKLNDY
jgi:hypothetical protein